MCSLPETMATFPRRYRYRSAPSGTRTLGVRSDACARHKAEESELSMVRTLMDTMIQHAPPPSSPGPPSSPSSGWPAMYVRLASGLPATRAGVPPIFQLTGGKTAPPGGSKEAKKEDRALILSHRSASPNHPPASPSSASRKSLSSSPFLKWNRRTQQKQRKLQIVPTGRTRPVSVVDRKWVLPVTSQDHSDLRLTGYVMNIYEHARYDPFSASSSPATTPRPATSVDRAKPASEPLHKRSRELSYHPLSQPQQERGTNMAAHFRSLTPQGMLHRLMKRPEVAEPEPKLAFGSVRRLSGKSPRQVERKSGEEKRSEVIAGGKVVSAESAEVRPEDKGVEGNTESEGGPGGALTISVFLPRESSSSRLCSRAEVKSAGQRSRTAAGRFGNDAAGIANNNDAVVATGDVAKMSGNEKSPDPDVNTEKADVTKCCVCARAKSAGVESEVLAIRRAIHCELFGPGLCRDCKLRVDRFDVISWQDFTYPNISTDPRRLIAAPRVKAGFSHPRHVIVDKGYGGFPSRFTGASPSVVHVNRRTLNHVVTQNDIRSRIWASAGKA